MHPNFSFPEYAQFEFPEQFKSSSLNEKSCQTFRIQRTIACGQEATTSCQHEEDFSGHIEEEYVIVNAPYE